MLSILNKKIQYDNTKDKGKEIWSFLEAKLHNSEHARSLTHLHRPIFQNNFKTDKDKIYTSNLAHLTYILLQSFRLS